MKRKTKKFSFGDWKRTTNPEGKQFYFYKGKRVSFDRFAGALKRRLGSKKRKRKEPKQKPKKRRRKPDTETGYGFDLCSLKDRQSFYDRILQDRKGLRDKISEEEISALRVDIDIGETKKTKRGKMSGQGYRRFRDLRKLRNFLGLNVKYDNAPDFSRRHGICQYRKTAYLVVSKMRGEREIGKKILKRYVYEPF